MSSETEIAWAAGLFEGEGSIHANRINGRVYLLLNLSSTDRDVVERFHRIIGCGKVYGPYYEKNPLRPRYSWHTKNKADSEQALKLLEPWLCERRIAKAAEVRRLVAEQPPPSDRRKFDWEEAARLQREGLTLRAIASRFGVTHPTVLRAVRRVNA